MQHRINWIRTCGNKLLRKGLKHNWVKLIILLGIFISIYSVSVRDVRKKTYPTKDLLGPAYSLIRYNGNLHIDDIQTLSNYPDDVKLAAWNDLRFSIQKLIKTCSNGQGSSCESQKYPSNRAILTLFTTWVYDKDKFYINNNTLHNWKRLPNVNLVIFSNDTDVIFYGKKVGWDILPVTEEAVGAPLLPVMFKTAMSKFKSDFYGFANGDLLFTNSLTNTLNAILCKLSPSYSNGILVVGKRTNVPSALVQKGALSWEGLEQLASQYGTLFQADAEDYFITDKNFPWTNFLPLAVGRTGYDNWVVTYARIKNVTVIDSTETALCVHQTMESRGNYEGHGKGEYNVEMIEKLNLPLPVFRWGETTCAEIKSWSDLCNNILFSYKSSLPKHCKSHYLSHRLLTFFGLTNNTFDL